MAACCSATNQLDVVQHHRRSQRDRLRRFLSSPQRSAAAIVVDPPADTATPAPGQRSSNEQLPRWQSTRTNSAKRDQRQQFHPERWRRLQAESGRVGCKVCHRSGSVSRSFRPRNNHQSPNNGTGKKQESRTDLRSDHRRGDSPSSCRMDNRPLPLLPSPSNVPDALVPVHSWTSPQTGHRLFAKIGQACLSRTNPRIGHSPPSNTPKRTWAVAMLSTLNPT